VLFPEASWKDFFDKNRSWVVWVVNTVTAEAEHEAADEIANESKAAIGTSIRMDGVSVAEVLVVVVEVPVEAEAGVIPEVVAVVTQVLTQVPALEPILPPVPVLALILEVVRGVVAELPPALVKVLVLKKVASYV
jgi:hypothetical protein